jgi:gas vesicle protein
VALKKEYALYSEKRRNSKMADRGDIGKILIAFFAGASAGAIVGLLLAPSSGAETRQKIKDTTITVKDKAVEKIGEAKESASSFINRGKEKVSDVKSQIKKAVVSGKESYNQKKSEMEPEEET